MDGAWTPSQRPPSRTDVREAGTVGAATSSLGACIPSQRPPLAH